MFRQISVLICLLLIGCGSNPPPPPSAASVKADLINALDTPTTIVEIQYNGKRLNADKDRLKEAIIHSSIAFEIHLSRMKYVVSDAPFEFLIYTQAINYKLSTSAVIFDDFRFKIDLPSDYLAMIIDQLERK